MSTYDIIQEYGYSKETIPDSLTINASWVMCVFRFKYPYLFDVATGKSFTTDFAKAVEIRGKPFIITDQCVQMDISSNKSSHLSTLNATLLPSHVSYMSEFFPQDYVFAWMFNNQEDADAVIGRIKDGATCNHFMDGLKFVGRLNTIHKKMVQQPDGRRTVRYSMSCVGFSELDSTIFYEPALARQEPALGQYFAQLGIGLNAVMDTAGNGIDVNKAIPFFFDLLLGKGVPPNNNQGIDIPPQMRSTAGTEAPHAYVVPAEVGNLIDKRAKSKQLLTFADTVEVLFGIQSYAIPDTMMGANHESELAEPKADFHDYGMFAPVNTLGNGSRRWTGTPMLGTILPMPPQFSGKAIWSIIHDMINPSINEMYMTLRCNGEGRIVPTMVARQLPFSTPNAAGNTKLSVTPFLDLPRWKIHPIMVKSYDVGRSDSLRTNFIHVYGDPGPTRIEAGDFTYQIVNNPPARNDLDIGRAGLRPNMGTINCAPSDRLTGGPSKWIALLADFQMGQSMTVTGFLETTGIQAPICIGDNLEWDDVVYHIESINHSCGISADGRKIFNTSFGLTYGVAAEPTDNRMGLYASMVPEDQSQFNPGLTCDDTTESVPVDKDLSQVWFEGHLSGVGEPQDASVLNDTSKGHT